MKYLNKLKKLSEKEQTLYTYFYRHFDKVFDDVLGISRDILLAQSEIVKTVSERYTDSVMMAESNILIDEDYMKGLLTEIADLFQSLLDNIYNNRYVEEDDDDYEEKDPFALLFTYTENVEKYYNTTLFILFNRILPQPFSQEVVRSFMDISDVEFERIYRSRAKYLSSEQKKFRFIMSKLQEVGLLDVIQYYNKNYDGIITELKETITIDDIVELTSLQSEESENNFKEKIERSVSIFDKFHSNILDRIINSLPIIRKSFESEVFYKEGTIVTIRNALVGDFESTRQFKKNMDIVFKALEVEKLDKVTYGMTVIFDTQSPYSSYITKFGGAYFPLDEDDKRLSDDKFGLTSKLDIEMLVANSVIISPVGNTTHTIAHEIGHRFYYVFLDVEKRHIFDNRLEPIRLDMDSLYRVGHVIHDFFKVYYNSWKTELDITKHKSGATLVDIGSTKFASTVVKATKTDLSTKTIKACIHSIFRKEFLFGQGDYGRMFIFKFPIDTILELTTQKGVNQSIAFQKTFGYDPLWAENISTSSYAESYLMQGNRKTYRSEAFAELFAMYVLQKDALNTEQLSLIRNALVDVPKQVEESVDNFEFINF